MWDHIQQRERNIVFFISTFSGEIKFNIFFFFFFSEKLFLKRFNFHILVTFMSP